MDLSIIVVSFNTRKITTACLNYLKKNLKKYPLTYELIIVDNNSTDGSKELLFNLKKNWPQLKIIFLNKNLGYTKANNLGLKEAQGKYTLFLNSDVFIKDIDFLDLIQIMEYDKLIGALTIKVNLQDGSIDYACHRGFPTLWRSFCYFVGLENLFTRIPILNRVFGGYHLAHLSKKEIHEIEVISGAFFFSRTDILKKIGGFDEDYFVYGEDVELCFQIKKLGYKILYYPLWEVTHLKYSSGLKNRDNNIRPKTQHYFYQAMKIFYQKHYAKYYPNFFNKVIYFSINMLEKIKK